MEISSSSHGHKQQNSMNFLPSSYLLGKKECLCCREQVDEKDFKTHKRSCERNGMRCSFCSRMFLEKFFDAHEKECQSLKTECSLCKVVLTYSEVESHNERCLKEKNNRKRDGYKRSVSRSSQDQRKKYYSKDRMRSRSKELLSKALKKPPTASNNQPEQRTQPIYQPKRNSSSIKPENIQNQPDFFDQKKKKAEVVPDTSFYYQKKEPQVVRLDESLAIVNETFNENSEAMSFIMDPSIYPRDRKGIAANGFTHSLNLREELKCIKCQQIFSKDLMAQHMHLCQNDSLVLYSEFSIPIYAKFSLKPQKEHPSQPLQDFSKTTSTSKTLICGLCSNKFSKDEYKSHVAECGEKELVNHDKRNSSKNLNRNQWKLCKSCHRTIQIEHFQNLIKRCGNGIPNSSKRTQKINERESFFNEENELPVYVKKIVYNQNGYVQKVETLDDHELLQRRTDR